MRNAKIALAVGTSIASLIAAMNMPRTARAADSANMSTWSISGSTAMRNFTISGGFSALEAGSPTLTLANGTYTPGASGLQLAPSPFTGTALPGSSGAGVRIEWHEQGSVEGILELVNDQTGYLGGTPIVDPSSRNPTAGNPIRINRNNFTAPGTIQGFTISNSAYNTYNPANYNVAGTNLLGGQNRVQMAISDVNARQGFSRAGSGTFNLSPTSPGFGKGNALLTAGSTSGLGVAGGRQQLVDDSLLNMESSKVDPQTGANYGTGAWNTATTDNLVNKTVATTATVFAANPGTGLTKINRGDAQWLQVSGRLQNGLDFNVAERDVNSGTRNVAALNTGVDPSWAAGENDEGNGAPGNPIGDANLQASIGDKMRFSGKTAGGAQLRPTVQNNRMALGPLGLSDARSGNAVNNAGSSFPLRALEYSSTDTDAGANFVRVSAASITDGSYVIWQNQTYVTVRTPDANYGDDNSIKGDPSGDVAKMRNNVLNSVTTFPNPLSTNNPADALLNNSFILPQMMTVSKQFDGGSYTNVGGETVNGQTHAQWRSALLGSAFANNFNVNDPSVQTAGTGSQYGVAPVNGGNSSLAAGAQSVPITAQDNAGNATSAASAQKGNYLFGNFNQNGVRDFDAVKKALTAQAALTAVGAGATDVNNLAIGNNTKVLGISPALDTMNGGTGPSKGDLVVMGDFNGDGKFNGRDLYSMARGVAVSDASGSGFANGTLSATAATFGDAVRSAQLRKNAALDYMNANTTPQQKIDASANPTNDPTGALSFNKAEVNRDGVIDLKDAKIVDYFAGASYRNLAHQSVAVVGADGDSPLYTQSTTFKPISLVDVELTDSADGSIDTFDFRPVRLALGSALKDGDTDFNGVINFDDYSRTDNGFNTQTNPGYVQSWSKGDFDSNGIVNFDDYSLIDFAFNQQGSSVPAALAWLDGRPADMTSPELRKVVEHFNEFGQAYANSFILQSVPEPTMAGVAFMTVACGALRRRSRRGARCA